MIQSEDNEILDLRGVSCPQNSARVLLRLAETERNGVFRVIIDGEEAVKNIVLSLKDEGAKVISSKNEGGQWLLTVKKI